MIDDAIAKPEAFKDIAWLRENYITKGRSIPDIASEFGVTPSTINYYILKSGLQRRLTRPLNVEVTCGCCSKTFTIARRERDKRLRRNPNKKFICSKECAADDRRSRAFGGRDVYEMAKKATATRVRNGTQEKAIRNLREGVERYRAETPDWRARISDAATKRMQTPEGIEASRRGGVNATVLNAAAGRETSIERKVREFLERASINHIAQHPIRYWVTDFYLPDANIVIECQGDYWHGNPAKFAPDALNATQRKNRARDAGKRAYLEKCGYTLIELWESDINANFALCVYRVMHAIQNANLGQTVGLFSCAE